MAKKMFDSDKLRTTVENQEKALQDRFDKADSILLKAPPTPKAEVTPTPQRIYVIRDTFSMPPDDYALIEILRKKAAMAGYISNKSEIIRAGLHFLDTLNVQDLVDGINNLEKMTPGRKI